MTYKTSFSAKCLSVPGWVALTLFAALAGGPAALAKSSSWKDAQGTSFRGEPMEILGPWALFKTGPLGGRRVFLRGFPQEESRRLYEELAQRPSRAPTWAAAHGLATSELVGRLLQVQNKQLVPVDFAKVPEPQLLLVLYGSHNDGESWEMLGGSLHGIFQRVQRVYPALMATVFFGIRHNILEHREMALNSGMPWFVAELAEEDRMKQLARFVPAEGTNMVLMSRDGVPLLAARAADQEAMRGFVDQLTDILAQIDPLNPRNWKDRATYLAAIRPVQFAQSRAEPLLIGSPLRPDILRRYGVTRVKAQLAVAADGTVSPKIESTAAEVPPALVGPLTEALRRTLALPGIDAGKAVAGTLSYTVDVPPTEPWQEAERWWLGSAGFPELAVSDWLVLRPIKVSEQDFTSEVIDETASGTVVFKALQVSDAKVSRAAQMDAFHSDWFADVGAMTVKPVEGEKQMVDGTELKWQRVKANKGYVDLRDGIGNVDYTVGYAYAEIDSPIEGQGYLGLGSDDGVRIWLNGELIYEKWIRRPSRIDDDVVPLPLRQGRNRLLLKIQNATIDWSFVYRIRINPR